MSTRLIDPFGRSVDYIRLSVTDRCDLRCFYCLPGDYRDFSEPEEWLTFDEIERVIRAFAALGCTRVRVTGGEPLVRKNLPTLVTQPCRAFPVFLIYHSAPMPSAWGARRLH